MNHPAKYTIACRLLSSMLLLKFLKFLTNMLLNTLCRSLHFPSLVKGSTTFKDQNEITSRTFTSLMITNRQYVACDFNDVANPEQCNLSVCTHDLGAASLVQVIVRTISFDTCLVEQQAAREAAHLSVSRPPTKAVLRIALELFLVKPVSRVYTPCNKPPS